MAIIPAVVSAGVGIAGAVAGGSAQSGGADQAAATQLQMYQQTRSDLLPYNTGGQQAFGNLQSFYSPNGPVATMLGLNQGGGMGWNPGGAIEQGGITGMGNGSGNTTMPSQTIGPDGFPMSGTWGNGSPMAPGTISSLAGLYGAANVPGYAQPANTPYVTNSGVPIGNNNSAYPSAGMGNTGMALSNFSGMYGMPTGNPQLDMLRNMPGYQFTQQEGINALDRSAASKGLLLSGGQLRDVTKYGQGLADTTFQTQLGNLNAYGTALSGMASLGENAAAQTGNAGATAAANAGNAQMASGQATANMYGGIANQLGNVINNSAVQTGIGNIFGSGGGSTGDWSGSVMDDGSILSDRRAKTDIHKVGQLGNGLGAYTYRLKGDKKVQLGVMADEVRRVAPHAVRRGPDGLDRVNYGKISNLPLKRAA